MSGRRASGERATASEKEVVLESDATDPSSIVLRAIAHFIELRRSDWGAAGQTGMFSSDTPRYAMLQNFRKAVERGELAIAPPDSGSFEEQVFGVWRSLAENAARKQIWGHPVSLQSIYSQLPFLPWEEFLLALAAIERTDFELVPSRNKNWVVGDRQVGALTFHQEQG